MTRRWAATLVDRVSRLDVRRTGLVLFAVTGVMAVMGILAAAFADGDPWFDLDSEVRLRWPLTQTTVAFPAAWSGLVLLGAALAWVAAAILATTRMARILSATFALFLVLMAGDEVAAVHERLQGWTRIDWMVLYAPLVALMAVVTLGLLRHAWRLDRTAFALLLAGCASWGCAQFLELVQWDGDFETEVKVPTYLWLMVPEELLEVSGSILFALAGLRVVHVLRPRGRPDTAPGARG